jgi:hypothetical protein
MQNFTSVDSINGSLVIAIKLKAKFRFYMVAMLYILQKIKLQKLRIFQKSVTTKC